MKSRRLSDRSYLIICVAIACYFLLCGGCKSFVPVVVSDSQIRWSLPLSQAGMASNSVTGLLAKNDTLFITGQEGTETGISAVVAAVSTSTGALRWKISPFSNVPSPPSIFDHHLFLSSFPGNERYGISNSNLYSISINNRRTVWSVDSNLSFPMEFPIIGDHSRIFDIGGLFTTKHKSNNKDHCVCNVAAFSSHTGKNLWIYKLPTSWTVDYAIFNSKHDALFLALSEMNNNKLMFTNGKILMLSILHGRVIKAISNLWMQYLGFAVENNRIIWFSKRGIQCIRISDMKVIWQTKMRISFSITWRGFPCCIQNRYLYFMNTFSNRMIAIDMRNGALKWSVLLNKNANPLFFTLTSKWIAYLSIPKHISKNIDTYKAKINWINKVNGKQIYSCQVPDKIDYWLMQPHNIVSDDSCVYIATMNYIYAFSDPH